VETNICLDFHGATEHAQEDVKRVVYFSRKVAASLDDQNSTALMVR